MEMQEDQKTNELEEQLAAIAFMEFMEQERERHIAEQAAQHESTTWFEVVLFLLVVVLRQIVYSTFLLLLLENCRFGYFIYEDNGK